MIPKNRPPTHPGDVLLHEFLSPKNLNQVALAEKLEIPIQRINTLLSGEFGTSPEFWMNLQTAWDLYFAHLRLKAA